MIWLYRGVWTGGKFNNTPFWKKLLSFSCFQLLNILGTKQVKPVRWVCLKYIHEYDFLIEFILGKWPNIQGVRNLIFFRTKCLFFFVKNTFLGMILNWGEFLLTSPIYRGSRLYNAGTRPWIYLAKYSPSVRKHRHSGQILLYSCHSRLPLAAYFAIKRNTNIMLILMLTWMLYVSN